MITALPSKPSKPVYDALPHGETILLHGLPKCGKCHGKGTKILMYDGSIRSVEEIKVGDKLMGDDSTPRTVLSLARGRDEMYVVSSWYGDPYTCNGSHVLCLKQNREYDNKSSGTIHEVSVEKYLEFADTKKHFMKGYHVPVKFRTQKVDIDPYFLGIWLSDGCSASQLICTPDKEVVEYLQKLARQMKFKLIKREQKNNKSSMYTLRDPNWRSTHKNGLKEKLKKYGLIGNKHIPQEYKANNKKIRLELLAGLVDGDGYVAKYANTQKRRIEFIFKSEKLMDGVIYLCRSLGFSATKQVVTKKIKKINFEGTYYRASVNGDLSKIPTLIKRKELPRQKLKKDVLRSAIKIKPNGISSYYGFTLDGNGRYLLGDFTVTHNTTMAATWPNNCIIEVERSGAKWVKNAYVAEPRSLEDFEQIIKLLKVDRKFEAVTLDTVDTLSLWIERYICKKYNVPTIALAGGGYGIGRNELNTRLISYIDDLIAIDKTVILISHCRDDKGSKSLLLTETLHTYIAGQSSIIGYAYKELKGERLVYSIDYSGQGMTIAGSRNPILAKAGVLPNNYKAFAELFQQRPDKWDKMLKWYEKKGIGVEEYNKFIRVKYGDSMEMDTLSIKEVRELIKIGASHTKNADEFDMFKEQYGTNNKK